MGPNCGYTWPIFGVKSHSLLVGSIHYHVTMFRSIMYSFFSMFEVTLCSRGLIVSRVIGIKGYTMLKLILIGGYHIIGIHCVQSHNY